jgi:aspartyl-tRNA(Asn)/glutamyl-tRNA(Gln) amidotransferase subunit C
LHWGRIVASILNTEKAEIARFREAHANLLERSRSMALTTSDVAKVAMLARLRFSADELEAIATQLSKVLDYVDQLQQVDTSSALPMAHAVELSNVFADDTCGTSLDREAALGNAPQRDGECFLVPAVMGD